MRKRTSILGLAIATILTGYILTLSNQVFAQPVSGGFTASGGMSTPHMLTKLAGETTKSALGDVCLSCGNGLAAHETQQGKELAGKLSGHMGANLGTGTGLLGEDAPLSHLNILGSGATLGQAFSQPNNGILNGNNIIVPVITPLGK